MSDGNGASSSLRLQNILRNIAPDGRAIFVWRGSDDTNRLTEAVASAGITQLFEVDGALIWRRDGQSVGVSRNVMHEIVSAYIVTVRLTSSGELEFYPFAFPPGADTSKEPDQQVLTIMQNDLKRMVAKGPSQPQRLSPQQHSEVMARLQMGEPVPRIAAAYGIDIAAIKRLAGAG